MRRLLLLLPLLVGGYVSAQDTSRLKILRHDSSLLISQDGKLIEFGSAPKMMVRLADGTIMAGAYWNGAYTEFVTLPPQRAGTSHPVNYQFGAWKQDRKLFPSDDAQRAVQDTNLGEMSGLVAIGNQTLAVIDWVNSAQSGTPTYYQHLVAVTSEGQFNLLRGLGRPQYRFTKPYRLWQVGRALYLHEGDQLNAISIDGKVLKKLVDLPKTACGVQTLVAHRWIVFLNSEDDPAKPLTVFDTRTSRLSTLTPPRDHDWRLEQVDREAAYLAFNYANSAGKSSWLIQPVTGGKPIQLGQAENLMGLWNGLAITGDLDLVRIRSARTGKLIRSVKPIVK